MLNNHRERERLINTRIRLVDVARKAGVSRVAAGRVLLGSGAEHVRVSEKAAVRIRKAARELGYQPNRSAQRLGGKAGNLIGAIVDTYAPDVEVCRLIALERLALKRGYQLAVSVLQPGSGLQDVARLTTALGSQGAAGIVFLTAGIDAVKLVELQDAPKCAVYCGIPSLMGTEPGVVMDLACGYRQAIRHFVSTGRKRIGVLHIDWGPVKDVYARYRLEAVGKEAECCQGVEIIPFGVRVDDGCRTPSRAHAEVLVESLLADEVDAVLAYSDLTAMRLIQVLRAKRVRIPQDMAICGLSNLEVAELANPALTTIDERTEDVATAMLDLLLVQLKGEGALKEQRIIRSELIVRASS